MSENKKDGLDRKEIKDFPEIPDNLPERIKWLQPRTPFSTIGQDVYCNTDRYQCRAMGHVMDYDKFIYKCPNCHRTYEVLGQDFIDWCKFRGEIRRYVDEEL